jgi:hypothetical protein
VLDILYLFTLVVQPGKRAFPDKDIDKLQEEAEEYNVTPMESLSPVVRLLYQKYLMKKKWRR